jgi:hypothetical protein
MEKRLYHMALAAKVPIVIAAGDFKRKTMYLGYKIPFDKIASQSYEETMEETRITLSNMISSQKFPQTGIRKYINFKFQTQIFN